MSVNFFKPFLWSLPEDDRDRQIANGFHLGVEWIRQVQILDIAAGWIPVLEKFESDLVPALRAKTMGIALLLIDFDDQPYRIEIAKDRVPEDLKERVLVLGALRTPERLKQSGFAAGYEGIGTKLAEACKADSIQIWEHEHLKHNLPEVQRMRKKIRPILFPCSN